MQSENEEEDGSEHSAAANKARMWIISQLCSVAQSHACSKATAVEVLHFLAAAAFVSVGPKGSKSKLAPVKLLAASEVALSEEVRSFAVARIASLATDRLPCAAVVSTQQVIAGEDDAKKQTSGTPDGAKPEQSKGKSKERKQAKQQYRPHVCLVGEV